jgi:hypothetical protein
MQDARLPGSASSVMGWELQAPERQMDLLDLPHMEAVLFVYTYRLFGSQHAERANFTWSLELRLYR